MVRQARSEATRRTIIASAVGLINSIGYPASGLADIMESADATKGAFYYHFDSKDALASEIIQEGAATVLCAFRNAGHSTSPALTNMVRGLLAAIDVLATHQVAQAACRLLRTFGEFNPAAKQTFATLLSEMTELIRVAMSEGDVRSDVDPEVASATIVGAMFGAELLSSAISAGTDLAARLTSTLHVLLPLIASADALEHHQDLLAQAHENLAK